MRWCTLCLLLVLLLPWSAWGTVRFVGGAGASDGNPGTDVAPYATIQRCATLAVSGDSCRIRAGTYRETVTPAANGVIYEPDGAAVVTVSGADLVTGWTVHSGSIYKSTSLALPLGLNNQVFVDGQAMNLARWPNASLDLSHPAFATADTSTPNDGENCIVGTWVINDSALSFASGFWNGAEVTQLAAGMFSQSGTVTSSSNGQVQFTSNNGGQSRCMESPRGQQYPYYLSNKLAALDTGGEWYWDGTTLYLWTPDSTTPTGHTVEAKRRQWAFDLSGRSTITIRNLKLFAASVTMNSASSGNTLDGLDAKYVWHQLQNVPVGIGQTDSKWGGFKTGIVLDGSTNILKNCTIRWSSHNGVYIHGTNNVVDNCTISDVNYLMTEGGAVSWMGDDPSGSTPHCTGNTVKNSTMHTSGRHIVNFYYCPNILISHNQMYDSCITTGDCGIIYTSKGGASGTIEYNLMHDNQGDYWVFGVYMDADPQNYTVHHNVVWNMPGGVGINIGGPAVNINVYNNSVWHVGNNIGITNAGAMTNVKTYNNIVESGLAGNDEQNNLETTTNQYVDPDNGNFQLLANSSAVNTGRSISGITTNCVGTCDIGAYERGATPWIAGATAPEAPTCPSGCTCTVTPGVCDPVANSFYVAPNGLDTSPGTSAAPFQHIQKCASVATSGQTCIIRAGTYRETVTPAANGITFQPEGSDVVTVSGADLVTGWTVHSGSIYKSTSLSLPLGVNNQVFVDGVMMNLARFPNTSLDVSHPTFAVVDTNIQPTSSSQVEGNDFGPYIFEDSALTQPNGFWVGAEITSMGGDHWSEAGVVTAYTTGHLEYDNLHQTQQRFDSSIHGGHYNYYLSNKLGALDTGGEWYYDSGITTLYLWTPTGDNPSSHVVEGKRRQWAFELSGRSNITVKNLNIFAASINMNSSSSGNVLDGITVKYVWHQLRNLPAAGIGQFDAKWGGWMTGIIMHGSNNILKNCEVAFSSHNGVYLHGTNNTVDNCTIHDVTYLKTEGGGVSWMGQDAGGSSPGCSGPTVSNSTIYNTGNEGINAYYCPNFLITHNHIHNWGIQTVDNGCFYTSKGGTSGTLSYNHCHDTEATGYRFGIYMDANPQNYTVHHNVVWNVAYGINVGEPSLNVNVYNNTIWFVQDGFSIITLTPGSSNVKVYNNLAKNGIDPGTDPSNNLETSSPGFVDVNGFNFQLQGSSPAVNAGRSISGITTNCVGTCDIGAYEFGATPWTVGATAAAPTCPSNCTCTVTAGVCDPPVGGLNPVAWWKMEDGTGSSVADSSGNNRTGTIQGPIWTGGRLGQFALQFDGINDVVSLPDPVLTSFSTDHTVCQWAQVTDISAIGTGTFKQTLVNLAQDTSNGLRIVEAETGPVGGWAVSVTAGGTTISRQTTTAAFTNNSWIHLCHTLSAGTLTLYTSGVAQATTDPFGYSLGAGSFLGGRTPTEGNLGGKLDEVKIWNRALSASEIQSEAVGPTGTPARVSHRSIFK